MYIRPNRPCIQRSRTAIPPSLDKQAVGFDRADEEYDIFDCWEALDRFRTIRLADLPPGDDLDLLLDIEEMLHYANPANGAVSVVLPGLLLLFHCPDAL